MRIRPAVAELFQADRPARRHGEANNSFRKIASAPNYATEKTVGVPG
jgi:hypothetical protein